LKELQKELSADEVYDEKCLHEALLQQCRATMKGRIYAKISKENGEMEGETKLGDKI